MIASKDSLTQTIGGGSMSLVNKGNPRGYRQKKEFPT